MTSEQIVKEKYPKARAERYRTEGWRKETYYLIWSDFGPGKWRLGEGETESKAWVDAKDYIKSLDK